MVSILSLLTNWCVMLYFIILAFERTQSLIRSAKDKSMSLYDTPFHSYVNTITMISIGAFITILIGFNREFIISLFTRSTEVYDKINLLWLNIAVGVILLSGMVHTEYTIPPIQFGSYGFLIIALIFQTILHQNSASSILLLWMSLVFLILFSMAIPVVYESHIAKARLFHITEAFVSALLVAVFAYLSYRVFVGRAENLFLVWVLLITVIGDVLVLGMRWKESKNMFVLIFFAASSILWFIGFILQFLL